MKKLNDPAAAAQAFEAAGEVDRAIELYRQTVMHEAAGDLLRRIGEEDAALAEYAAAAALLSAFFAARPPRRRPVMAAKGPQARAGDRGVSQRVGPAARGQRGALRPRAGAASCRAGHLGADHRLCSTRPMRYSKLPGQPYNGYFYNELTRLALLPAMEPRADDLRDRVLESMARKLRQGVEGGQPAAGIGIGTAGKVQALAGSAGQRRRVRRDRRV